jgi:Holliday junction resolvase RusA-like endonuclease
MTSYALPMPPSLNEAFANFGNRRIKTDKYRAWRKEATQLLKLVHKANPAPVPCRITIALNPRLRYDLDNRIKPVLDALVSCRILVDDSNRYVTYVAALNDETVKGCLVTIEAA